MAQTGSRSKVKMIHGKDETRRFLESLGFVEGGEVTVVSELGGVLHVYFYRRIFVRQAHSAASDSARGAGELRGSRRHDRTPRKRLRPARFKQAPACENFRKPRAREIRAFERRIFRAVKSHKRAVGARIADIHAINFP